MFIEISPHEGVFELESAYNNKLAHLATSYRLNLNLVQKVFFGKTEVYEITLNQITFEVITTEGEITFEESVNGYNKGNFYNEEISLYFTKEGEGEYQRIKRIIDENTSR
jgi:hypothetical protein